jgi:hypothetical protein
MHRIELERQGIFTKIYRSKYQRAYHRSCVIPGKVCPEEARFISLDDFIERHIRSNAFKGYCMFNIFLGGKKLCQRVANSDTTQTSKINLSYITWPISNAFCFSFVSTHWPIQINISECVSSIIMSSVSKSSCEKLKTSVTCIQAKKKSCKIYQSGGTWKF